MNEAIRYRGKTFAAPEIKQIRDVIDVNPGKSRRFISQELCRQWGWTQPNGSLKDMVCRGLLKQLEAEGLVVLPPRKQNPPNPFLNRKKPDIIEVDQSVLSGNLAALQPIELLQVRRTAQEKLYNSLIEQHHYLGYSLQVGEHVKYIAYSLGRPVACIGWCSAPRHIGCRDLHIGWNKEQRKKNISLIATNTRFLILPWVKVPHLASHLLGLCARRIGRDWERFSRLTVDTEAQRRSFLLSIGDSPRLSYRLWILTSISKFACNPRARVSLRSLASTEGKSRHYAHQNY